MRLAGALLTLLLLATPAAAVQITHLRLNCDGVNFSGGLFTDVSCRGQGLWLDALVTGFPVATPPVVRFALTVDDVLLGEDTRTLPASLGPIYGDPDHEYSGLGVGWQLPLPCASGCTGHAMASLGFLGTPGDPAVAFDLDVPAPEPTTLLLWGTTLTGLGWWWRRRQ